MGVSRCMENKERVLTRIEALTSVMCKYYLFVIYIPRRHLCVAVSQIQEGVTVFCFLSRLLYRVYKIQQSCNFRLKFWVD